MEVNPQFPLSGIIGVVSESPDEIKLATRNKLQCVEIRADLLLDKGFQLQDVESTVKQSKASGLATLVTLRHPDQGGKFTGTEKERVTINRQLLAAGADIIDLEWGTAASRELLAENAPMILSNHDFNGMPSEAELASLTESMVAERPLAVKVVPTASTLEDAVRMLTWVKDGEADSSGTNSTGIRRIGFAMGSAGACSRILTTAFGGPVTYTSFGKPVAPGQIELKDLIETYRVMQIDKQTTFTAVVGELDFTRKAVAELNAHYKTSGDNMLAIGFPEQTVSDLQPLKAELRISQIFDH